ncbi:MAG: Rpn family recombination-promoting nuclease/putative transposase, partial [Spirochaetes bacterium]|nr:Rpn family recombination-promoting nuclease/putative transposase [Spirochaetota bacterium]
MIIEIDPKVDVVFHNLFGSPEHSGLTLSFVNSLLAKVGLPIAVELEICNPFLPAKFVNQKSTTLDILYKDAQKRQIQLEMQMQSHAGLSQRMLHNWSQVYQRQLLKGDSFHRHIPVISVWILNESLFKDQFWLHYFQCYDCQSRKVLHGDMNVVTVELPVWQKTPEAGLATSLDYLGKWLYFLSKAKGMEQEQLLNTLPEPEFSEAVELMSGFTKTE